MSYQRYHVSDHPMTVDSDIQKPRAYDHQMTMLDTHWPNSHDAFGHGMLEAEHTPVYQSSNFTVSLRDNPVLQTSQPLQYFTETSWTSTTDIASPMAIGYPTEAMATYHNIQFNHISPHLILTSNHNNFHQQPSLPSATLSPPSSVGEASPCEPRFDQQDTLLEPQRPTLTRSITAPERSTASHTLSSSSPPVKRSPSNLSDDDCPPLEDLKLRGRSKRPRIPHTAVERRYRENLNAHLDRLRNVIPTLAAKRPSGPALASAKLSDRPPDALKPSKCEVLNGAIEHICALTNQNTLFVAEIQALRERVVALEQWCDAAASL